MIAINAIPSSDIAPSIGYAPPYVNDPFPSLNHTTTPQKSMGSAPVSSRTRAPCTTSSNPSPSRSPAPNDEPTAPISIPTSSSASSIGEKSKPSIRFRSLSQKTPGFRYTAGTGEPNETFREITSGTGSESNRANSNRNPGPNSLTNGSRRQYTYPTPGAYFAATIDSSRATSTSSIPSRSRSTMRTKIASRKVGGRAVNI